MNVRILVGLLADTGEDVNVYAYGPQAEAFSGQIDNTDQAKIILA